MCRVLSGFDTKTEAKKKKRQREKKGLVVPIIIIIVVNIYNSLSMAGCLIAKKTLES